MVKNSFKQGKTVLTASCLETILVYVLFLNDAYKITEKSLEHEPYMLGKL